MRMEDVPIRSNATAGRFSDLRELKPLLHDDDALEIARQMATAAGLNSWRASRAIPARALSTWRRGTRPFMRLLLLRIAFSPVALHRLEKKTRVGRR
jgi:hypothetical protein